MSQSVNQPSRMPGNIGTNKISIILVNNIDGRATSIEGFRLKIPPRWSVSSIPIDGTTSSVPSSSNRLACRSSSTPMMKYNCFEVKCLYYTPAQFSTSLTRAFQNALKNTSLSIWNDYKRYVFTIEIWSISSRFNFFFAALYQYPNFPKLLGSEDSIHPRYQCNLYW